MRAVVYAVPRGLDVWVELVYISGVYGVDCNIVGITL